MLISKRSAEGQSLLDIFCSTHLTDGLRCDHVWFVFKKGGVFHLMVLNSDQVLIGAIVCVCFFPLVSVLLLQKHHRYALYVQRMGPNKDFYLCHVGNEVNLHSVLWPLIWKISWKQKEKKKEGASSPLIPQLCFGADWRLGAVIVTLFIVFLLKDDSEVQRSLTLNGCWKKIIYFPFTWTSAYSVCQAAHCCWWAFSRMVQVD